MIGERLAEIRKDHGDRQPDLAKKLNVTVSTVRSWEQNRSSPPHEMLVSICRMYDVSSDFLLGITDDYPSYAKRKDLEAFSSEELDFLKNCEDFLVWRRQFRKKR